MSPACERAGKVRRHRLRRDLDRARGEAVLAHEALARHHGRRRAVRGRTALEQGERRELRGRGQHLLQAELLLELRARIVDRVLVVLDRDPREGLRAGAVALHVLAAGVAEHLGGDQRVALLVPCGHRGQVPIQRMGAVGIGGDAPHLLEPERQRAVRHPRGDGRARHHQGGGARRAGVVHVDDGHARLPQLVDGSLAGGGVPEAVSDRHVLDPLIGEAGIRERLAPGLARHVGVVPVGPGRRLHEVGHPDTDDEDAFGHAFDSITRLARAYHGEAARGRR